jgi:hypothetical protein
MKLRVLYHGNCFDGVASAAVFTKFYLTKINTNNIQIEYHPVTHLPNNLFDKDVLLNEGENAIVDFKYCADERVTWWFDHHQSAFLSEADRQHFLSDKSGRKFLDVNSKSCCELIARIAKEKFDFEDESLNELIKWAHIIDGAMYESAAQCVELQIPAIQLMQVIEEEKDPSFVEKIIRQLTVKSIEEIVAEREIQEKLKPIIQKHQQTIQIIKRKATYSRGVVQFDLIDEGIEGYNKFIPYYLYPNATYSVSITKSKLRTKISVGSNPWAPRPRQHNIAEICEQYGGGGHAVVGAVSLPPEDVELGRKYMKEIVEKLQFDTD